MQHRGELQGILKIEISHLQLTSTVYKITSINNKIITKIVTIKKIIKVLECTVIRIMCQVLCHLHLNMISMVILCQTMECHRRNMVKLISQDTRKVELTGRIRVTTIFNHTELPIIMIKVEWVCHNLIIITSRKISTCPTIY